jgi:hypothetical protein
MRVRAPRTVATVLLALALPLSVPAADRGCCESKEVIPPAPGCFHPATEDECKALEEFALPELKPFRFVPDAKCSAATERCVSVPGNVGAEIDGPSRIFRGETVSLDLVMHNFGDAAVNVDQAQITLIGPGPGAAGQLPVPILSTLPALGKLFVPLFNGPIAQDTPKGAYNFNVDVFGTKGDGMKVHRLGGGQSLFKVATPNASITDPVGDVLERLTGNPAAPSAYVGEFDARAYHGSYGPKDYYGRIDFSGGPVLDRLGPGQKSKAWNVLVSGGACTFAGAIPGVAFVFSIEEETFDQPGSPLRYSGLRCVNGSFQLDSTPLGFRVGKSFVEMFGPIPSGLVLAGQQVRVVVFGFLEGQPPVVDVTGTSLLTGITW